jgi:hypothetical protein
MLWANVCVAGVVLARHRLNRRHLRALPGAEEIAVWGRSSDRRLA